MLERFFSSEPRLSSEPHSVARRVAAIVKDLIVVGNSISGCGSNRRHGWVAEGSFLVRIRIHTTQSTRLAYPAVHPKS